jgi:uncharacterized protein DUF6644
MLLPIFQWADALWVSEWIRASTWAFALLEVFHLFGLTVLLGTLAVVNLRLFGVGLKSPHIKDLASDAWTWMLIGGGVTVSSGFLLFASEAMKCYASGPFFIKITLLFIALIFTFTFQKKMTRSDEPSGASKLGAVLSMALWFGVGLAGRAIAFF